MDSKEMAPGDIERRSFEIITEELGGRTFPPLEEPVVKRVIHTTADFSYADSLVFTHDAAHCALDALRAGATVLTDTNMALAGISKPALAKLGCKAVCYMADPDVAVAARAAGTTRAVASMDKACGIEGPLIVAVGNAPTALLRLAELMDEGKIAPALVVGVPVGFVNVVEAKEELLARRAPAIVARGRKGGSTVAAAIMNALLYQITRPGGRSDGARICARRCASSPAPPRAAFCANGRAGRASPPCLRGNRVRRRAFGRASGHRGACEQARRGRHGARAFRRAHRRRRHAPLRYARQRQHPGRFACRGCTMSAPCACGRGAAKGVVSVASIACAARFLSENPGRALLTTGSKELAPYTRVADFSERFFVRVLPLPGAITKCIDAGFSPSHVIGMQGPFTRELNEAMLRQVGAQWLVTKDSGTVGGTAEKLARRARRGSARIVVTRPAEGDGGLSLREVEDALLREFAR